MSTPYLGLAAAVCLASGCLISACSDDGDDDSAATGGSAGTSGAAASAGTGGSGASGGSGGSGATGGSSGSGGASGAGTGGSGGIDTTGREEIWTDAIASEAMSCAAVCAENGDECAPVCGADDDIAVEALYASVSDGGLTLQEQSSFDICDPAPAPTMMFDGPDEYTLIGYRCCCLTVAVTRVMGDPANRIPCNDVCAAEGLTCHEATDWGVGTSGMLQTFSAVPTETRLILGDCDEVPLASVNRIGVDEPLVAYECGCVR